jgi:hypothetical protein
MPPATSPADILDREAEYLAGSAEVRRARKAVEEESERVEALRAEAAKLEANVRPIGLGDREHDAAELADALAAAEARLAALEAERDLQPSRDVVALAERELRSRFRQALADALAAIEREGAERLAWPEGVVMPPHVKDNLPGWRAAYARLATFSVDVQIGGRPNLDGEIKAARGRVKAIEAHIKRIGQQQVVEAKRRQANEEAERAAWPGQHARRERFAGLKQKAVELLGGGKSKAK